MMSLWLTADVVSASLFGLWAQGEPPFRGPGFYYSLVELGLLLIVYFCWIATCDWVNRDAEEHGLDVGKWNGAMLGAGLLGLLFLWVAPTFPLGFILLLILYGGATFGYLSLRDQRVPA